MTNKIHFVGAGPGDKELITLKGYKLLSNADIVIYAGSLVNPELLEYCKEGCEIHNSAHMDLQEIIDVMARGIREDKSVVRLQTGDFSIYGSIREQVEELFKLDIDYDCTPGVSSFLGAASALGVEYTVPEISQSVIITRMEGRTPVPSKESIESYAQHQTSMAIFLSVHDIEKVVERLHTGGYPMDTPIAVVYKATWEDEKIVKGTLEDIAQKVRENNIRKTALILVGRFLGKEYKNLFCMDLICHGVPSPLIWEKYLNELSSSDTIVGMTFRDKSSSNLGWPLIFECKSGNKIVESYQDNKFIKGFIRNYYLRLSCYECNFKGLYRCSDITIGDFWGLERYNKSLWSQYGTSIGITHTKKGIELFDNILDRLEYKEISEKVVKEIENIDNPCLFDSVKLTKKRKLFFKKYKNKGVLLTIDELSKPTLFETKDRILWKIRVRLSHYIKYWR